VSAHSLYPPNPFRYSYVSVTANWVTGIVYVLFVDESVHVSDCDDEGQYVDGGVDLAGECLPVSGVLYLMLISLFSRWRSIASLSSLIPCMKGEI
jgi:hypothetical protein